MGSRFQDYICGAVNSVISGDGDAYNFNNQYSNSSTGVCGLQCKPQKQHRVEDTEIGIQIKLREQNTQKEVGVSKSASEIELPALPTDCCHHRHEPKTRRKFICNFASMSADASNECLIIERTRCQGFWKLVDERPELMTLMRNGEFEHLNMPQVFVPQKRQKDTKGCLPNAEKLRARSKQLHTEEKDRANKRRQMILELQKRSGQPVYVRNNTVTVDKVEKEDDDLVSQEFTDFPRLVEEMNDFDIKCGNPVRTKMNPPSQTSSYEWLDFTEDDFYNEALWGEDETSEEEVSGEMSVPGAILDGEKTGSPLTLLKTESRMGVPKIESRMGVPKIESRMGVPKIESRMRVTVSGESVDETYVKPVITRK